MTQPRLTVCVCTYNRSELFRRVLKSLGEQTTECDEILVVDNGSTDDTQHVISAFPELPIRYAVETRLGLSHARNRALKEFSGDYLLFVDDDVRLAPDFVASYLRAIQTYGDIAYFGGRILPDWVEEPPRWTRQGPLPLIDGLLVWLDLGETVRKFKQGEPGPFGASFALSRTLIERVGEFSIELGCAGRRRGRGEETEWLRRARQIGAMGIYVGEALCFHLVDPARLTLYEIFRYGIESGAAHRFIVGRREGSIMRFLGMTARAGSQMLQGRGDRFRQCVINMGIEYDALRR